MQARGSGGLYRAGVCIGKIVWACQHLLCICSSVGSRFV
jgi:hypothetical protein